MCLPGSRVVVSEKDIKECQNHLHLVKLQHLTFKQQNNDVITSFLTNEQWKEYKDKNKTVAIQNSIGTPGLEQYLKTF